jgi:hypothetical protein
VITDKLAKQWSKYWTFSNETDHFPMKNFASKHVRFKSRYNFLSEKMFALPQKFRFYEFQSSQRLSKFSSFSTKMIDSDTKTTSKNIWSYFQFPKWTARNRFHKILDSFLTFFWMKISTYLHAKANQRTQKLNSSSTHKNARSFITSLIFLFEKDCLRPENFLNLEETWEIHSPNSKFYFDISRQNSSLENVWT